MSRHNHHRYLRKAVDSIITRENLIGILEARVAHLETELAAAEDRLAAGKKLLLQLQQSLEADEDGTTDNDLMALDLGRILEALNEP